MDALMDISDRIGLCRECQKRNTCKKLCTEAKTIVKQKGAPYEINRGTKAIELTSDRGCIRLSAMKIPNKDDDQDAADTFTYDDVQFNTDAIQETRTNVFCERFFHKRSFADIADQLNTTVENVYQHYHRAFEMAEKLLNLMGSRDKGLKLMASRNKSEFSYDEKCFLMNQIFGFSTSETADVLGQSQATVKVKVRHFKQKFHSAFESVK